MRSARTFAIVATIALLAPLAASAQKIPKRPRLDASSDSNSARAYYDQGMAKMEGRPDEAKAAFYWASRLDPRSGSAYYARRLAWFIESPRRFFRYASNPRAFSKDAEAQQMDSLYMKAMLRDPFSPTRLDPLLMRMIRREAFAAGVDLSPDRSDPADVAFYALLEGDYQVAADNYAKAITKYPKSPYLHVRRANALFFLGRFDSTAAELAIAVKKMATDEDKKVVVVYESKAMYEYLAGHALLVGNNVEGALAAFQRAAAEDLSFYMAHVRLAAIAQQQHDTATAMNEYETAVGLRGDDPILRYDYADFLLSLGKYDEARAQVNKAIEAEPLYAPAHLLLATLADKGGDAATAKSSYEHYVALAPRGDPPLVKANQRLVQLQGTAP